MLCSDLEKFGAKSIFNKIRTPLIIGFILLFFSLSLYSRFKNKEMPAFISASETSDFGSN